MPADGSPRDPVLVRPSPSLRVPKRVGRKSAAASGLSHGRVVSERGPGPARTTSTGAPGLPPTPVKPSRFLSGEPRARSGR